MKLSQCKHGVLVQYATQAGFETEDEVLLIGMVVGLGENAAGEAVPLIKFQHRDTPSLCHHELLELYEE